MFPEEELEQLKDELKEITGQSDKSEEVKTETMNPEKTTPGALVVGDFTLDAQSEEMNRQVVAEID